MKLFNEKERFTFGGYENPSFAKSKVVILPIPFEGTVTYGKGTANGPEAIISASRHMETYDLEIGHDFFNKIGIYTLESMALNLTSLADVMDSIHSAVEKIIKLNKFPVILGGEHSITPPCVKAFFKKYEDLTVVQIDADADLRDTFDGTKYSHACAMRRCREITKVVQVGVRSMSQEEADYIKKERINTIFYSPDINFKKVEKMIGKNVYLTIDLDSLNPALMPAVGTPEPGGLTWYPFINFIKQLAKHRNIVAADIVELAPIPGLNAPNFMAAVIAYKIILYKFYNRYIH
jgi:agmatinase